MTSDEGMLNELSLRIADVGAFRWVQATICERHYLHTPVDRRSRPLAYVVHLGEERVGCLVFGRPEATRVNGWFGSVTDVQEGRCPLTRWQVINLSRIWLSPIIQRGGAREIHNAATRVISIALRRVVMDYLLARPPVWLDEPYELIDCLSYCDAHVHRGVLYRAASFRLIRANDRGIQTYARRLRRLTSVERERISQASTHDQRARRLRATRARTMWQLPLALPENP